MERNGRRAISMAVLVACFAAAGCSSKVEGENTGTAKTPQQACEDTANAVGEAAKRCGFDYQASRDDFVKALGGCPGVVQVRDEAALRATCIPSFGTITCEDLKAGTLDATCKGQLLHKSIAPAQLHASALSSLFAEAAADQ